MNTSASEMVLRAILESWADAVRRKDVDGVLEHHAHDVLLFDVVPPRQARGLEAYRTSWVDRFFPWYGQDGRSDLTDVSVTAGDRVAFATAFIHCAGTERGKQAGFTLRLTVGFERRDGAWTIVHEHYSEPLT
jgi:uncharacterized protein (TIGR02246 family)